MQNPRLHSRPARSESTSFLTGASTYLLDATSNSKYISTELSCSEGALSDTLVQTSEKPRHVSGWMGPEYFTALSLHFSPEK